MKKTHLVIIDPQIDFCDPSGALYVPGAEEDMARLARLIDDHGGELDRIHVTMDQHHYLDIAHPVWWVDGEGRHPAPFTIIEIRDVESGKWRTGRPEHQDRSMDYVRKLASGGRYPLCIWPPHCLMGSAGAAIFPPLFRSLLGWEQAHFKSVNYVAKGENPWTEHYSAVQADVPDPEDPDTLVNLDFIHILEHADLILLAGEAGSHCLANTVRDVAANFEHEAYIKKLLLLQDATSPVPGFEHFQQDFIREMTAKGMQLGAATDPGSW